MGQAKNKRRGRIAKVIIAMKLRVCGVSFVQAEKGVKLSKQNIMKMIWRGAPLMTDEAEKVTKYLAASFSPDKPIPDEFKKTSAGSKP